jgi:hypothetical protein
MYCRENFESKATSRQRKLPIYVGTVSESVETFVTRLKVSGYISKKLNAEALNVV